MSANRVSDAAKDVFRDRVVELTAAGYSETEAVGLAARQLTVSGELRAWVFSEYDVDDSSVAMYTSDGVEAARDAMKKFILGFGGYRTVLASYKSQTRDTWLFIVSGFPPSDPDSGGVVDSPEGIRFSSGVIRVLRVKTGGPSGELADNLSMTNLGEYRSVRDLAEDRYLESDTRSIEQLWKWKSLLVDAGMAEEELPDPGELLPETHPDSDDHHNYQMTSLEGPESRNPDSYRR